MINIHHIKKITKSTYSTSWNVGIVFTRLLPVIWVWQYLHGTLKFWGNGQILGKLVETFVVQSQNCFHAELSAYVSCNFFLVYFFISAAKIFKSHSSNLIAIYFEGVHNFGFHRKQISSPVQYMFWLPF